MAEDKAAILGAGLSAWMVVAALRESNIPFDLYTDQLGAIPTGRVYYHYVPESVADKVQKHPILYAGFGTKAAYLARMDRSPDNPTAFPLFPFTSYGWEIEDVLNALKISSLKYKPVTRLSDRDVIKIASHYTWVFQTFPTEVSRLEQPPLVSYPVLVHKHRMKFMPNMVLYSAFKETVFTRFSSLFGWLAWEYSHVEFDREKRMPDPMPDTEYRWDRDMWPDTKPWDLKAVPADNVFLVGRWARWDRHYHSHTAYGDTFAALEGKFHEPKDERNSRGTQPAF